MKPIECIACFNTATIKDYRERHSIIDGYPVCVKHFNMDNLNFWKAVKRKTDKEIKPCVNYSL